jgi:hypothetical protein
MRLFFLGVVLSLSALLASAAQTPVATNTQALGILQHALAALSPNISTQDVTLSGSAHYIAGSDDETGTAILKATAIGSSRIDLSLSSGQRSEVYNFSSAVPSGQWSGPDGTAHAVSYHNLLNEPGWFSPVTAISRRLAGTGFVAAYVGAETLGSQSVHHISVTQPPQDSTSISSLLTHLTQVDLFIDSTTFLPAAMSFNIHPDDNELLDIPVEVRFSDYRSVNGAQIPFHIQKFLNNGLVLDLQLDSATINTGLSSSAFGVS